MKKDLEIKNENSYIQEIEMAAKHQIPISVNGKKYHEYKPESISSFLKEETEDYMAGYVTNEDGKIILIEYDKISNSN